jgi:hypothetical protein
VVCALSTATRGALSQFLGSVCPLRIAMVEA